MSIQCRLNAPECGISDDDTTTKCRWVCPGQKPAVLARQRMSTSSPGLVLTAGPNCTPARPSPVAPLGIGAVQQLRFPRARWPGSYSFRREGGAKWRNTSPHAVLLRPPLHHPWTAEYNTARFTSARGIPHACPPRCRRRIPWHGRSTTDRRSKWDRGAAQRIAAAQCTSAAVGIATAHGIAGSAAAYEIAAAHSISAARGVATGARVVPEVVGRCSGGCDCAWGRCAMCGCALCGHRR